MNGKMQGGLPGGKACTSFHPLVSGPTFPVVCACPDRGSCVFFTSTLFCVGRLN
jgi:hypothetical protein